MCIPNTIQIGQLLNLLLWQTLNRITLKNYQFHDNWKYIQFLTIHEDGASKYLRNDDNHKQRCTAQNIKIWICAFLSNKQLLSALRRNFGKWDSIIIKYSMGSFLTVFGDGFVSLLPLFRTSSIRFVRRSGIVRSIGSKSRCPPFYLKTKDGPSFDHCGLRFWDF